MGFVVAPVGQITLKVEIDEPGDYEQVTKSSIDVTYRKLLRDELRELVFDKMKDVPVDQVDYFEIIGPFILDIKGCSDPNGNDMEFNQNLLKQLFQMEYVSGPLVTTFMNVQSGTRATRRKN